MSEILRISAFSILGLTFAFYLYIFRLDIFDFIQDLFIQRLKALRSKSEYKHCYQILYRYDHKDPKDWLAWIQSNGQDLQERAFRRLKDYFSKPPKESDLIVKELVEVLACFTNIETYTLLENILVDAREDWKDSQVKRIAYGTAAIELMKLDADSAGLLLSKDFAKISEGQDGFKEAVLEALSLTKNKADLYQFFKELAFSDANSMELKLQALDIMEQSEDSELYTDYLTDLVDKYTKPENISSFKEAITKEIDTDFKILISTELFDTLLMAKDYAREQGRKSYCFDLAEDDLTELENIEELSFVSFYNAAQLISAVLEEDADAIAKLESLKEYDSLFILKESIEGLKGNQFFTNLSLEEVENTVDENIETDETIEEPEQETVEPELTEEETELEEASN